MDALNSIVTALILFVRVTSVTGQQAQSKCVSADNDFLLNYLLGKAQSDVLYKPAERRTLLLPMVDTAKVRVVRVDSLCNRAARTILTAVKRPGPLELRLVAVGNRYMAADATLGYGEWSYFYVLDSTLTRIVAQSSM
jgi:hypothetical protein